MPLRLSTLLVLLIAAPVLAQDRTGFHWQDDADAGTTDLYLGEQPVVRYMYASDESTKERAHETYKVYHHVFGPGTDTIITKGPGGQYTHHRGMYVGWNKTRVGDKSYDFWHCNKGERIEHQSFEEKSGDKSFGTMTALVHWNDPEGKPVIVETRTLTASRLNLNQWQLDWSTKLESRRGEIELNGDRQHAGFQFRAAQSVAEAKSARYIRPNGFPQQEDAFQVGDGDTPPKHVDLPWLAMTFPVEGSQYTVEYFEAPGQPKPSRYSERPYGRFGAFFATKLTEEKPLEMRYRVIVTRGQTPNKDEIQARYTDFVGSIDAAE